MSNRPYVSIIVPVYNTLPFLAQCMDSLLGQTLSNIEIICIDDGSTDGSSEQLDNYSAHDSRVTVIHQRNTGVSAARNAGLDIARGTFALFVDSDDYIDKYACEKLANVARRDGADIVIFGGETFPSVTWIDQSMSTVDATFHQGGLDTLFLARGAYPLMCNKLYRRSLLERHGLRFNTELRLGEDHAFQFCVFPHAKTVSSIRDHIYHYRCGREGSALSLSNENLLERARQHFAMVEYVLGKWKEQELIGKKGLELADWLTEFLLSSVRQLPLSQRAELAQLYIKLIQTYELEAAILSSASSASRHRNLSVKISEDPDVSAVVISAGIEDGPCMASLLEQELSRIELLCVGNSLGFVPPSFKNDPRVLQCSSLSQALSKARGRYVLIADSLDAYEAYSLRIMVDTADSTNGADCVSIQDRGGSLRVADLSSYLHALSNDGRQREATSERTYVTQAELPGGAAELFSLDLSNKLWRAGLAREHFLQKAGIFEVGTALSSAKVICPISEPYFEKGIYSADSAAEAKELATSYINGLLALKKTDIGLESLCRSALSLCMGTAERMAAAEAAEAFLDTFCHRAQEEELITLDSTWWPTRADDLESFMAICKGGASRYLGPLGSQRFTRSYRNAAEHEARHAEYLRALTNEREWRTQALESVSYRLGRHITQTPRTLRDLLKSILRRS